MFRIRQTTDIELLKTLNTEIFPGDFFDNTKESIHWIVLKNHTPVGFGSLRPFNKKICFLSRSGLLDSAQGHGLHKKLIRLRIKYAKAHGCNQLCTYTVCDNLPSQVNLIKCGFLPYIPEYAYAGKAYKTVVYYMLNLD